MNNPAIIANKTASPHPLPTKAKRWDGMASWPRAEIKTDENMQTNIKGVFAAGDVRVKKFRQITTAVSDGAVAALSAIEFLQKWKKGGTAWVLLRIGKVFDDPGKICTHGKKHLQSKPQRNREAEERPNGRELTTGWISTRSRSIKSGKSLYNTYQMVSI